MEPVLQGRGFSEIPVDAIGIGAVSNDNPLQYVETTSRTVLMQVAEKNEFMIRMTQDAVHVHNTPVYIGALVSADRQTVYWVNESRPLP